MRPPLTKPIQAPPNCGLNFTKHIHWIVSWIDGYDRSVTVSDDGQRYLPWYDECQRCWPDFHTPTFVEISSNTARWNQLTSTATWTSNNTVCSQSATHSNFQTHRCGPPTTEDECAEDGWYWNFANNTCSSSPPGGGSCPGTCTLDEFGGSGQGGSSCIVPPITANILPAVLKDTVILAVVAARSRIHR